MYDIFVDNSDCRLCDSYNCFYGFYTGLLFCDRLTLGPVIIASLISIIPIMNVFVACNAYGDLSRQEREGMTKYSLFCKLFYMEL